MFRSLKAQVFMVISSVVMILLLQVALSESHQSAFLEDQESLRRSAVSVSVVQQLERDVVDLQRNVLVYINTDSELAADRFHDITHSLRKEIVVLKNQLSLRRISQANETRVQLDLLRRMNEHLDNYEDNFNDVISGRRSRSEIITERLEGGFEKLIDELNAVDASSIENQLVISQTQRAALIYLLQADYESIELFDKWIGETSKSLADPRLNRSRLIVTQIKKDFTRLVQVTRGYAFLVNVVMAGSANEFLYLTKELRKLGRNQQRLTDDKILANANQVRLQTNVVFIACLVLALIAAYILNKRILLPIREITNIFKSLSENNDVALISYLDREDEIGKLATAANVFKEKNKQTSNLLLETQLMFTSMEVLNIELAEAKEVAEQAALSKSNFLANMSHEIRTPMNGIMGLINLLLRTKVNAEQKNYLDKAIYSSKVMMGVINDVLDFSKIEAGKLNIEQVTFSIADLIEGLISSTYLRIEEKKLNCRVHFSSPIPAELIGDPLRITQVLLNLCSNATKFTSEGLIEIDISYQDQGDQTGMLVVVCSDTGIGLNQKQKTGIFDSFSQADDSTSREYGGTGLGLAIVKQLVELMQGSIEVTSTENVGSQFSVKFLVSLSDQTLLLCPMQEKAITGFYVSEFSTPTCRLAHFELSGIVLNVISWNRLRSFRKEKAKLAFIDVGKHSLSLSQRCLIEELSAKDWSIGFSTDMQPSSLKDDLESKLNMPVLSHPFSPKDFISFTQAVTKPNKSKNSKVVNEPHPEDSLLFKGHVLIVEDNEVNQIVIESMLEDLGLTFDTVSDGGQAVGSITTEDQYDVVLMDVQMPVMDGYEATRNIRMKGFEDLVICGLSANAMKQDHEKAMASGMNDYLTKPIEWDELGKVFSKYLAIQ
jgi:signal transduction histidine kinase/CheY-like chemotaxis protein